MGWVTEEAASSIKPWREGPRRTPLCHRYASPSRWEVQTDLAHCGPFAFLLVSITKQDCYWNLITAIFCYKDLGNHKTPPVWTFLFYRWSKYQEQVAENLPLGSRILEQHVALCWQFSVKQCGSFLKAIELLYMLMFF